MKFKTHLIAAAVLCAVSLGAQAQTVRVANQGDSLSMDPHSLNESLQLSVTGPAARGLPEGLQPEGPHAASQVLAGCPTRLRLAPCLRPFWLSMRSLPVV